MWRWLVFAIALALGGEATAAARIKDIVSIQGVRENQLVGYGLVVGLKGTGDTMRNSPYTEQSLQSLLDRMGINVRNQTLRARNVAAVMVTADFPAFGGAGARIDVSVSSLGDATSLMGGTLLMTPLSGADNKVYAVAQGPLAVAGFSAEGAAQVLTQGVPTTGRIPNGALIEREVPGQLADIDVLVLELRNPDFATAIEIVDAVNRYGLRTYGFLVARERDFRSVLLYRPQQVSSARFLAEIGNLMVRPDTPARVVVDERSGTVVIGKDVQVSTVAVSHGNLTVRITEAPVVSQPPPFSRGQTVVTPQTFIEANQPGAPVAIIGGTDLQKLVRGLNQIGLKPSGIIAILQAIKSAGALQADLIVQ
jgi:flagellar P-ring protein precursor FlgI